MDTPNRSSGARGLVALAYATRSTPKWKRQYEKQALPGPLFDAVVLGLFLVFGAAYLFV
jgi:hypothetical protein